MTGVSWGPVLGRYLQVACLRAGVVRILLDGMANYPGDSDSWEVLSDSGASDNNFSSEHVLFGKEV